MAKPKFDPSKKFESMSPKFDPNADFESVEDPSILESAVRGAAQGLTFGLADEATGALESTFSEKTYEQARDESRKAYQDAEKANPGAYLAGDVSGSIATAFIPGFGALNAGKGAKLAEVAGKAALQGGLTGFGKSEAEGAELAVDSLQGAAIGGALGSAAYGVGKGISKASETWDNIGGKEGLKQVSKAFRQGAKEGREVAGLDISNVPVLSQVSQAVSGGKRAISEIIDLASTKGEFDEAVAGLSKTFGPGAATDLSNNDILMKKLLEQGIAGEPNAAHKLVASKYAAAHGGDANQYLNLLKRSPAELADAQAFNPRTAGEELAPSARTAFDEVQSAAGRQYDALKNAARDQFTDQGEAPIGTIRAAIEDATRYKSISGNTRAVLDDTYADLLGREGQLPFMELPAKEQFDRVLEAKQRLGKAVKWASKNELPEGQQILSQTYQKFQGMLQALDDMKAADKGYAGFKRLEKDLFSKLGTVERGRIKEFDPIKMEKLFSGSATGRGLMAQVQKAKDMLDAGLLPEEQAQSVRALITKIEEMGQKAALKRDLTSLRYDAGPSSPALERIASISGKDSATTTAVKSPQLFLKMKGNAEEIAKSKFGKSFSQLGSTEQTAVGKLALWMSQNPEASANDIARKFNDLTK
ncbi:MAG: hypothetical protein M3Q07_01720 [Pseudobdellovibrionaceae bacterium]|nr:hypothetical protein [Pseudobdellovibrionaceae bacterium]